MDWNKLKRRLSVSSLNLTPAAKKFKPLTNLDVTDHPLHNTLVTFPNEMDQFTRFRPPPPPPSSLSSPTILQVANYGEVSKTTLASPVTSDYSVFSHQASPTTTHTVILNVRPQYSSSWQNKLVRSLSRLPSKSSLLSLKSWVTNNGYNGNEQDENEPMENHGNHSNHSNHSNHGNHDHDHDKIEAKQRFPYLKFLKSNDEIPPSPSPTDDISINSWNQFDHDIYDLTTIKSYDLSSTSR